jgi:predicted metal-dependent phosphoesterase TrpH
MLCSYDLHSHSTASDGVLPPADLARLAASSGVRALALTDHDTTAGVQEAASAANPLGLHLIPGVEISVTWNKLTVHIVGLNLDVENTILQQGLAGLREFRDWRGREIGRRLEKSGYAHAYEGAKAFAKGGLISRTHFARHLVKTGASPDERSVFKHFLVNGKPGHVAGSWATLEEAVGWIHAAGGEAVIAHPARYPMTRSKLRRLIQEFVELGGDAMEVITGSHSLNDCYVMAGHAKDFNLMASAGSDFHSCETARIKIGQLPKLPDGCVPIWRDWELPLKTAVSG